MHSSLLIPVFGALVHAQAQGPPPPPATLSTTKSGVLPIIPTETPFTGVETNEGAIINPGPVLPGFVGPGGTATAQSNLPVATYRADLPSTMFDPLVGTTIEGSFSGVGTPSGVRFMISLSNLPSQSEYGPFGYHIHTLPVPEDGNCTATMGHLDPTNRGELHMCDAANPETCQVGDLAGKHGGKIKAEGSFEANYVDAYLSTDPSSPSFFGGLSVVIHSNNATRLTCANFMQVGGNGTTGTNSSGSGTMAVPTATMTGLPEFTGAASKVSAGLAGVVGLGFAAMIL